VGVVLAVENVLGVGHNRIDTIVFDESADDAVMVKP
jgi:hypothetical protein